MRMKRNRQNLAIFRAFNCEDSDGWDEGTGARIKGEAQLCGLNAWVVGNPRSPGGEQVLRCLILSMLFKRCPVSSWI